MRLRSSSLCSKSARATSIIKAAVASSSSSGASSTAGTSIDWLNQLESLFSIACCPVRCLAVGNGSVKDLNAGVVFKHMLAQVASVASSARLAKIQAQ